MVSTRKAWWLYSIIRVGLFAVAFTAVWLLGARWWLAAVLAALISAAISILTLGPLREQAAQGLQQWRTQERTEDDIVEDDIVDAETTPLEASTTDPQQAEADRGTPPRTV